MSDDSIVPHVPLERGMSIPNYDHAIVSLDEPKPEDLKHKCTAESPCPACAAAAKRKEGESISDLPQSGCPEGDHSVVEGMLGFA